MPTRVVLLCKRGAALDESLARLLEADLIRAGFSVFIDRHQHQGMDWARELGQQIREADVVIPLLSQEAMESEMLMSEVETAHDAAQERGRPKMMPILIGGVESVPEPLAGILDPMREFVWRGPEDNGTVIPQAVATVRNLPAPQGPIRVVVTKGLRLSARSSPPARPVPAPAPTPSARWLYSIEPPGGAVPLNSEFYVQRPADTDLRNAVTRYDSIILVKGARQMGKTSMLARGLQFARERAARTALTDFQKFNASNLESVGSFYLSLAESLADQLELSVLPSDVWDERRGPNVNFERFVRREVLGRLNAPLVWGLDEVDRLFVTSYGSEVFGLFRSWHNERALDPSGPWSGLTLAIAYATEAHLFITDMNQSPFNIGTRLSLDDFTVEQVTDLNERYASPLKDPSEIERFMKVVGGHPYLVRRGLHELATKKSGIAAFEAEAGKDEGVFGDHLRRILVLLAKDPVLTEVVRSVLRGQPCPTPESFYRLRSAGVMSGGSQSDVRPRCELYAAYLRRHLLG
jgi:hypothetical protein